jgi:hypothetical protein
MVSALEAVNRKLLWATEHLKAVDERIDAYAADDPYEIVTQSDGCEHLHILNLPDIDIAIGIGEMVYQLRSALDHLTFDLVKHNPNAVTLPADWEKDCQFPLRTKFPQGSKPPLPYSMFSQDLPGISKSAFAFIEGLQPYNRGNDAAESLGHLVELSNIDKHRHLNLTPVRVNRVELITLPPRSDIDEYGTAHFSTSSLEDGAEIKPLLSPQEMARAVKVERSFCVFVLFDESALGKAAGFTIHHILQTCLNTVQGIVVPAFEQFLNNP